MSIKILSALALITLFASGSTRPHGAQRGPYGMQPDTGRSYGYTAGSGYGQGNHLQAEPPRQFDSGHRHGHGCGHAYHDYNNHQHHHHHHEHDHDRQYGPHAQPNGFGPPQPQFYPRNPPQGSILHQPPSSQPVRPGFQQPHNHQSGGTQAQHPVYVANTEFTPTQTFDPRTQIDGNSRNSNPNSLTPSTEFNHRFQPTKPKSQPPYAGTEVNTGFQYPNPGGQRGRPTTTAKTPTILDQNISEIFNTKESKPLPDHSAYNPSNPKTQVEEVMPDSINDRGLFDTPAKCAVDEIAVNGHCRKMA